MYNRRVLAAPETSPRGDLVTWTGDLGLEGLADWLDGNAFASALYGITVTIAIALLGLIVARRVVLRLITNVVRRSAALWDDLLVEKKLLGRLSWAVPWLLIDALAPKIPDISTAATDVIHRFTACALVWVTVRSLAALLNTIDAAYNRFPSARNRPIKGYLQIVLLLAWIIGAVLMAAILLDRSPWLLLSGFGALTAVFLLVFRDTLLSLVAGIRLTTNDLIRVGDWIEMPQFGADGDVVELALHAVKVRNWDNTFSIIPTHSFLEHSFRNWRGMTDAGGRRIKRAINIDLSSIRFLDEDDMQRFGRFRLLREYIATKRAELDAYNGAVPSDADVIANGRRLTNIGTLRAYAITYLREHPGIHRKLTLMVRQLAPSADGLPLEIYAFSSDTAWTAYEALQADIFDHLLAIIPEFGLRVFQSPGGADVAALAQRPTGADAAVSHPSDTSAPAPRVSGTP